MIILKELKWENCFSYAKSNSIRLDEVNLTQILGVNGAGKSSIPLIIEEALYNQNSKGIKKGEILNRCLEDKSYGISLTFQSETEEYKVTVNRSSTLKVRLEKDGKDISSHTATNTFKNIKEILGLDFKVFSQLVYQNSNSTLQFLTATDTNRKKFLINLLDLEKYVEYFEIFKKAAKEYNTDITVLSSKIETIGKWLQENNLKGMEVLPLQNLEIHTEEDEKLLGFFKAEFENISEKNKKISRNNLYKTQLNSLKPVDTSELTSTKKESYDEYTSKLGELSLTKRNADASVNKVTKLGDKCPTCKQNIDESFKQQLLDDYNNILESVKADSKALEEKISNIKANNVLLDKKVKSEKEFESLYRSIDSELPEDLLDAEELKSNIAAVQKLLKEKRQQIKNINEENIRRERNNTKIHIIEEQTDKMESDLNNAKSELAKLEKVHGNLEILKKSFSTNGFLAYKIEFLVKELEDIINKYLLELSDGRFGVSFEVTNDKLNVVILDNGVVVNINNLSSGEQARITTATLLSIRTLMNGISKSRINVLFLDEVIGVLDDQGREKLIEVLVKEDKLNTFIVSHEWTHPLLTKLNIIKENNISRVE